MKSPKVQTCATVMDIVVTLVVVSQDRTPIYLHV